LNAEKEWSLAIVKKTGILTDKGESAYWMQGW